MNEEIKNTVENKIENENQNVIRNNTKSKSVFEALIVIATIIILSALFSLPIILKNHKPDNKIVKNLSTISETKKTETNIKKDENTLKTLEEIFDIKDNTDKINEYIASDKLTSDKKYFYKPIKDIINHAENYYFKLYDNDIEYDIDYQYIYNDNIELSAYEHFIYDSDNNEIIFNDNSKYNLKEKLPECSIGDFLIYKIAQDESESLLDSSSSSKTYDLISFNTKTKEEKLFASPINDYVDILNDIKLELIKDKIIMSVEKNLLASENYDLEADSKISLSVVYDKDLNILLPAYNCIITDIININDIIYYYGYQKRFFDNANSFDTMLTTYQVYKGELNPKRLFKSMGVLEVNFTNTPVIEINDRGHWFKYNLEEERYVYDIDNDTSDFIMKDTSDLYAVNYIHLFDDGAISELRSIATYRLVDEFNNDLGIISDKPISAGTPCNKSYKGSLLIKERVYKDGEYKYYWRTLDEKIIPPIDDTSFDSLSLMHDNLSPYYTRIVGFVSKDHSTYYDLLNGYHVDFNKNQYFGFFIIKGEIYFARYNKDFSALNFYSIKDQDNVLFKTSGYEAYRAEPLDDGIIVLEKTSDDEVKKATILGENLEVKLKTSQYKDYKAFNYRGNRYYQIIYSENSDHTQNYDIFDDDFNMLTDDDLIKAILKDGNKIDKYEN